MSSAMAQNVGAHKDDRVRKIFHYGIWLEIGFGLLIGAVLYIFAGPIMRLFTKDADVIKMGTAYLHLIAFMYPLPALTNALQGYFRGIGDMKITLISSLTSMAVRILCCWILTLRGGFRFEILPWTYLAGWIAMTVFELPYLVYLRRKKKKLL